MRALGTERERFLSALPDLNLIDATFFVPNVTALVELTR